MKKSVVLAGSLLVVAAAYTGAAWYVGMEAEKTIRAAVEQANERVVKAFGPDFTTAGAVIRIDDYQRGVFSSQARYSFVIQDGDNRTEFALLDDMQHGPFPWSLVSQGSLRPALAHSSSRLADTVDVKRWFAAARGAMPLSADTRIGFGGNGATSWVLAPLEWAENDESLSFSGGRMDVRFSNNMRDSEGVGGFASLVAGNTLSGETLTLNDIRLESRTATAADDTVQMHSTVRIASLAVDAVASETVTFDQLAVTLDSTQKASLLDAAMRYDVQRLRVGDIDLGSLSLGGSMKQVDFEALSALLAEYDAIAREHGAQEGEDFELTQDDETRLLAGLIPVLASHPEVALQPVTWRNDKGETSLSFTAALQALPEGDAQIQEEALADSLRDARFELVLSRPMLLQAVSQAAGGAEEGRQFEMLAAMMFDAYIGRLEQQGLVSRDGDNVLLNVHYQEGELDVNGQPMSVDEFFMLLEDLGL